MIIIRKEEWKKCDNCSITTGSVRKKVYYFGVSVNRFIRLCPKCAKILLRQIK
jgi:hypothetical protein